ncbi:MAG: hypothetical protein JOZ69_17850 [Myxococcales bacterium]|nr:hypothetical protein [Myxococcales bacterium]
MLDVVCFGEILWDLFEVGGRGTGPGAAGSFRRAFGGAPANVATALARLGARAAVVGAVGEDAFGDALVAHLRADAVDTRFVVRLPNRTGITFVFRDAKGEPRFLFYRQESADLAIRAEHVLPGAGRARWALVGSSTLMTPSLARATRRFLDVAEAAGACVALDLNVRTHLWSSPRLMRRALAELAARADLIKASEDDLRLLAGGWEAGTHWLRRHGPRASWLLTRGAAGASAVGEHGEVHAPALRARHAVDATGAGDAFVGGALAVLLAAGASPGSAAWRDARVWAEALKVGHMMGSKAVSQVGAVAGLRGLHRARAVVERARRRPSRVRHAARAARRDT